MESRGPLRRQITKIRHVAYRIKFRYLLSTDWYRALIKTLWPVALEGDFRVLWTRTINVYEDLKFTSFRTNFARSNVEHQTPKWNSQCESVWEAHGDIEIEPRFSIAKINGRWIEQTKGQSHFELRPSISNVLKVGLEPNIYYPEVVHLDGFVGRNLFHFIYEGINSLGVLDIAGQLNYNTPLLVNSSVYRKPFVQTILNLEPFRSFDILVQDESVTIRTHRLIKASPSFSQFEWTYGKIAETVRKSPHRKIFLDRREEFQRRIINDREILEILRNREFEHVFAEDLSFEDQIVLFSEASHVVALHGAGMTNLLFADLKSLRVLELNSASLANPCFFWMTGVLGVSYYETIFGSEFDLHWNFSIDVSEFRMALDRLMNSKDPQ